MRLVISQQVQQQVQEREKEKKMASPLQRNIRTSKSFRLPREEGKKNFFSSLFGGEWKQKKQKLTDDKQDEDT